MACVQTHWAPAGGSSYLLPVPLVAADVDPTSATLEIVAGDKREPLAWGDGFHHHLSEATLHTTVSSPAPETQVRELIADAEAHCPVCQAISGRVALRVTADVAAG